MVWSLILGGLKAIIGPVFDFLNKRVDAEMQIHIVDTKAMATIAGAGLAAESKADELNAQVRMKEGTWGPTVIFMALVLSPLIWHEWQVVLDSSRWLPAISTWYGIPYLTIVEHDVGSWKVPTLPGAWAPVELAIFQSFFIGAAANLTVISAIKAIRR